MVWAEGLAEPELHALALHELSHLFFYGTAPEVMPDWYAEGFAETFGAPGTFTWDGKNLTTSGVLRKDRLDELQAAPLPLREMFAGDAAKLLASDRAKGLRWEAMCRGVALGAVPGEVSYDASVANQRFSASFAKDLPELEKAFFNWLSKL